MHRRQYGGISPHCRCYFQEAWNPPTSVSWLPTTPPYCIFHPTSIKAREHMVRQTTSKTTRMILFTMHRTCQRDDRCMRFVPNRICHFSMPRRLISLFRKTLKFFESHTQQITYKACRSIATVFCDEGRTHEMSSEWRAGCRGQSERAAAIMEFHGAI